MNTLRWQLGLLACLILLIGCASAQTPVATGTPLAFTPSPPIAPSLPAATRVAPTFTPQPQPTATATTDGAETLALVNGTLMDGTGAAPLADAVVVIRDRRIVGVGVRAAVLGFLPGYINPFWRGVYPVR